ncbi:MAG: TonB-dependent receptor [Deltaproteobacteria bacterium]
MVPCAALVLVLAVLGQVGQATGDEQADNRLRPIVVIADPGNSRFEVTSDAAGFTSILTARNAWRGYQSVADVIERSAGVHIQRFGGREDFSAITVRGANPGQVKILLDGVSLSHASLQAVNLTDLPMDAVERIEVYRGFSPLHFVASGAASVINIVTRKDDGEYFRGSLSHGSFNTTKVSLQGGRKTAGGQLDGVLSYRRTDGDFSYLDDNGTPQFDGDDSVRDRNNNDRESLDLLARYTRTLKNGYRLTASNNLFIKDEGLPGLGSNESSQARLRATRDILSLAWLSPDTGTAASVSVFYLDETLLDPKDGGTGTAGLGLGYTKAHNTTLALDSEAHGQRTVAVGGLDHLLRAGLEAGVEIFQSRFPQTTSHTRRDQERIKVALALGDEIYLPRFKLALAPELRLEALWNSFDGSGLVPALTPAQLPSVRESSTNPRLGLRWDPKSYLTVKANIATYFRPPDFSELFGDDGFSVANPTLRAETGVNRDAGFIWHGYQTDGGGKRRSLWLEYAYFNNDADDMIAFVQTGSRTAKPMNIGKARVRGHELSLVGEITGPALTGRLDRLGLEVAYTNQNARNLSQAADFHGMELPSLPRHEAHAVASLHGGSLSLAYRLHYQGGTFLTQANNPSQRSGAHASHDLTLSLHPQGSHFQLQIEGLNLGNQQSADQFGFPVPGRACYLTLSFDGG